MILSRYHNEQFLHWLYVIIMPRTSFRVNLHSVVCLNVKELLARSWRHIWSLSDSNGTRTHNHLFRKRTLNHLAQLSGCGFESRCSFYIVRIKFRILTKWYEKFARLNNALIILGDFMMLHFINFNWKFLDISMVNSKGFAFFEGFTKRRGPVIIKVRLFVVIYFSVV